MPKKTKPSARVKSFEVIALGRVITFTKREHTPDTLPYRARALFVASVDGLEIRLAVLKPTLASYGFANAARGATKVKPDTWTASFLREGLDMHSGEWADPKTAVEKLHEFAIERVDQEITRFTELRNESMKQLVIRANTLARYEETKAKLSKMSLRRSAEKKR